MSSAQFSTQPTGRCSTRGLDERIRVQMSYQRSAKRQSEQEQELLALFSPLNNLSPHKSKKPRVLDLAQPCAAPRCALIVVHWKLHS